MLNETRPKVSIIMVDGAFRESFHSIDFFCNQTLPFQDYELYWVEHYSSVNPELQAKIDRYPNAYLITLNREGIYHSSYCFNAGILAANAELLVIPDGDVIVERDFLERVWQEHQSNDRLVMYIHRYNEAKVDHVEPVTLEHLKRVCRKTNWAGNFGACLTIRKKWLLQINGYDQHPEFATGLHANGWDINMRVRNLGLHIMWHPQLKLFHAWHRYTDQSKEMYNRQTMIIQHRGLHLITQAYHGIDSTQNQELPPELVVELNAAESTTAEDRQRRPRPNWLQRIRKALPA